MNPQDVINALIEQRNSAQNEAAMVSARAAAGLREIGELKEKLGASDAARFALLLDCYRSGQIPEAAWQEHLADAEFAAFVQSQS